MASSQRPSAQELLQAAARSKVRLERHLLVAASLRVILAGDPIVVGGTAEEFWTEDEYHETDLDLCVPVSKKDREALRAHHFEQEGRHWYHARARVAVEFPDSRIDGDEGRTETVQIHGGAARVIGLDDLYLDRLRHATLNEPSEQTEFMSALAVATTGYERLDRGYIRRRVDAIISAEGDVGLAMRRLDASIRRRARNVLSSGQTKAADRKGRRAR